MEIRQEQDEILDKLRKQLHNLGGLIEQTEQLDNVQTLDRTYDVNLFDIVG